MSESTYYTLEQTKALGLYLRQQLPAEIAPQLGVSERTVQDWALKFGWKKLRDDAPVELTLRQRINFLLWLDPKTEHQISELGLLMKQHLGDVKKITGNAKDGSRRGAIKNVVKNNIEKLDTAALDEFEQETFFPYQLEVLKEGKNPAINWMRF